MEEVEAVAGGRMCAEVWKRRCGGLLYGIGPGMKEVTEAVRKKEGVIDENWFDDMNVGKRWWEQRGQFWMLLRKFADGGTEGRKTVTNVRGDHGWRAWMDLGVASVSIRHAVWCPQTWRMSDYAEDTPRTSLSAKLEAE